MYSLKTLELHPLDCSKTNINLFRELSCGLKHLCSLKTLLLAPSYSYVVNDKDVESLSLALACLSSLKNLNIDFEGTQITDFGIICLVKSLEKRNDFKRLDLKLYECNIGDEGVQAISELFSTFSSLKTLKLDFSGCLEISSKGIMSLVNDFQHLGSLRILNLNFSELIDMNKKTMSALASKLKYLLNLESLSLNFNYCTILDDGVLEDLSKYLQRYQTSLVCLELEFIECSISDKGLKSLYSIFYKFEKLEKLLLYFGECCSLTENKTNKLFMSLKEVKMLKDFCCMIPEQKEDIEDIRQNLKELLPNVKSLNIDYE